MSVDTKLQKSIKVSPKGYERLSKLQDMLTDYYHRTYSMNDTILWLILKSGSEIESLHKALLNKEKEVAEIEDPTKTKTVLDAMGKWKERKK